MENILKKKSARLGNGKAFKSIHTFLDCFYYFPLRIYIISLRAQISTRAVPLIPSFSTRTVPLRAQFPYARRFSTRAVPLRAQFIYPRRSSTRATICTAFFWICQHGSFLGDFWVIFGWFLLRFFEGYIYGVDIWWSRYIDIWWSRYMME